MRPLVIAIVLILVKHSCYGQTFLESYKKFRLDGIKAIEDSKTRKKIKTFIKSHITELDTVFRLYKDKTDFDFNSADTLFLIYESPLVSPFTSDIIIWSGRDTISYKQGFETIKPFTYKRIITYESFIPKIDKPKGYKVITERDSLITLVSKRDFNTINHLGDNQSIDDGSHVSIYVAYKDGNQYRFETCFPNQFIIPDRYERE